MAPPVDVLLDLGFFLAGTVDQFGYLRSPLGQLVEVTMRSLADDRQVCVEAFGKLAASAGKIVRN